MEPIRLVIDGEQTTATVYARDTDAIVLDVGGREAEMTRAELRRLMLMLAGGHSAALAMESELVRIGAAHA